MFNFKNLATLGIGCGIALVVILIGVALFFSAVGHVGLNLGADRTAIGELTCPDGTTSIVARDGKYLTAINSKLDLYKKAALESNVPWELLAAIHYRENEFGNDSLISGRPIGTPEPDQGGRIYKSQYETAVSAGNLIHTKMGGITHSTTDPILIKKALFAYNGEAKVYKQQAATLGFNPDTQGYEGSPYVMNNFDAKHKKMSIIRHDHGGLEPPPDARDGGFTVYALLKGATFADNGRITTIGNCKSTNGTGDRLGVDKVHQLGGSNCNDTAVYIAAKYLARKYNKIEPGTCPIQPPPGKVDGSTFDSFNMYMRHFGFSPSEYSIIQKTGFPSDSLWQEIKKAVNDLKTPVVVATGFGSTTSEGACGRSGYFTHYIVIEGFSSDGQTALVSDPSFSKDPNNLKHGNSHLLSQNGGKGQIGWQGAYCNILYAKIK